MITSYFTIVSEVNGKTKTEGFYLSDEIMLAMEDLDKVAEKHLGEDFQPFDDGTLGFYTSKGRVYLEEISLIKA